MGFIETKQKAQAYDDTAKRVAEQNAEVARQVEAAKVAGLEARRNAELEGVYKKGQEQGLANFVTQINPGRYSNVPDERIPGYRMPIDGGTNQQMYKRPAVQPQVEPGLWSTLLNKAGIR